MSLEQLELQMDLLELENLGLEQEEIDGYLCFFIDTYVNFKEVV